MNLTNEAAVEAALSHLTALLGENLSLIHI